VYNNVITYHEKWNTPENCAAKAELEKKFLPRSHYAPSCPIGWAPEVLAMLSKLDSEFGIYRNESTINGYFILPRNIYRTILNLVQHPIRTMNYISNTAKVHYLNPVLNRLLKPKIRLDQIKEKYGALRVYTTTNNRFLDDYIDECVKEVEIKLAIKGCYYPIESFWNSSTSTNSTSYYPDTITISAGMICRTTYRNIMKNLGLDIKAIEEISHVDSDRK